MLRVFALTLLAMTAHAQRLRPAELLKLAQERGSTVEFRDAIRNTYKPEVMKMGGAVTGIGPDFIWIYESEREPTVIVDGQPFPRMTRVVDSNYWFLLAALKTGEPHAFIHSVDGKPVTHPIDIPAYGADSYPQPGVPEGKVTEKQFHTSKIYPGMISEYWVYTPPQYDPAVPLPLMVWQDGYALAVRLGPMRLPVVTDNLIHQKKIPPMIHVMISPGTVGEAGPTQKKFRSIQYDTVDNTYARFLREEILAEIGAKYKLRSDSYSRAIAGMSSGAICAFNVAWLEGDQFSRVASYIGSFTAIGWKYGQPDPKANIDGGNVYPFKVRKEPRHNLRIWLDDGSEDMEAKDGSWPLQNIQMANSLKMAGYDFRFHFGPGVHSLSSAAASMPEALAWLWRGYDPSKTAETYLQDESEKAKPYFRVRISNR